MKRKKPGNGTALNMTRILISLIVGFATYLHHEEISNDLEVLLKNALKAEQIRTKQN